MAKLRDSETLDDLINRLQAKQTASNEWRCACPVHGGKNKSAFAISQTDDGKALFHCFAGCSRNEIGDWLKKQRLTILHSTGFAGTSSKDSVPDNVPYKKFQGAKLVATYRYQGGSVGRYEKTNEDGEVEKSFIPFFKDNGTKPGFPDGNFVRPLYNGFNIKQDQEIFIVEGEKCADALKRFNINAITWPGGANAVMKANWGQLSGKNIFIWADNDEAGRDASQKLADFLQANNQVSIISIPEDKPDGWDVADYIKEMGDNCSRDKLMHLFKGGNHKVVKTLTLPDYMALDVPPVESVLGWLQSRSINTIYAWRGLGKSWFALSVAYSVACGIDFLKWKCSRPARIFYIDGEMGTAEMQERLFLLAEQNNGILPEYFVATDPDLNDGIIPKINTPEGRALIDAQIELHKSEFIFVDNISMLVGGDENDAQTFEPIQDWAVMHKSKGRTVTFIDHSNKSSSQRGSSKKQDATHNVIVLKDPNVDSAADPHKEDGRDKNAGAEFLVSFEKGRNRKTDKNSFVAWLEEVPGKRGNLSKQSVWKWCEVKDFQKKRIERLHNDGYSLREIERRLNNAGVSKSTIHRMIKELNKGTFENDS